METVICLESALEIQHAARIYDDSESGGSSDPSARVARLPFKRVDAVKLPAAAPDPRRVDGLLSQFGQFADARLPEGPSSVAGLTAPVHVLVAMGPHDGRRTGGFLTGLPPGCRWARLCAWKAVFI